mmetsp:Transcript_52888/g.104360  ORF Transcript_52888/g.104360 Transcript_52888/m.104360 type:complete len:416 (-) Transcript_52888:62-1309(-)
MSYLSKDQIEFYDKNGYIIIERFWDEDTVGNLKQKIAEIVQNADLSEVTSVFSTKENMRKADDYFLTSGGEIRFFWEEKARDENGEFVAPKEQCINKVGHALHDLVPEFEQVSYEGRVGSICEQLGLVKPMAVQSMYIFKQAKIGGVVVPHQDGAFLYTEPQSCIGFWWPLNDCTLDNGCLWAVPGSHKLGVHRRFRRQDPPGEGTEFVPLEPVEWDTTQAVPLVIPKGSLVVLHSALVHFSKDNHSDISRHAYSIHVVDGKEGVTYPADNWLQRPADQPFREITKRYTAENPKKRKLMGGLDMFRRATAGILPGNKPSGQMGTIGSSSQSSAETPTVVGQLNRPSDASAGTNAEGGDVKAAEQEDKGKGIDDLFRKTTTKPAVYWLPAPDEVVQQRLKSKLKMKAAETNSSKKG